MSDLEIAAYAQQLQNKPLEDIECTICPSRSGTGLPAMEFDHLFKLIVIGDSGVGKSCLMHRVTTNEFMEDHEVTVGVEFGTLMLKIEDTTIKL